MRLRTQFLMELFLGGLEHRGPIAAAWRPVTEIIDDEPEDLLQRKIAGGHVHLLEVDLSTSARELKSALKMVRQY